MEDVSEQAENMKIIQESLSAPVGVAAELDEVCRSYTSPNLVRKMLLEHLGTGLALGCTRGNISEWNFAG